MIPAFTGFYLLGLSSVMPYVFVPLMLPITAGFLIITGALIGPETRDVEMQAPVALVATEEAVVPRAAPA